MYSSLSIIDRRLRKLLAVRQLGLVQTLYFSCSKPNWITERHWRDIWFRRRIVCRAKLSSTKVGQTLYCLARENSRHLATLPLVSPPNDVWETSAEIPYWWRVTTQIWLVVPGGKFDSANQKHYPDLGSDASSVWNFCVRFSDVISGGNQCWRCEMSAVFSGYELLSWTKPEMR